MSVEDLPVVLVSKEFFDRLLTYSCSLPTGTVIGKWWKAERPPGSNRWLLCAYGLDPDPTKVKIHRRRLDWVPWAEDGAPVVDEFPAIDERASFR